jgi:hypothetical protein
LDADNVGDKIELALLDNDVVRARTIHDSVRESMRALSSRIEARDRTAIIMVGCDDILLRTDSEADLRAFLENLMRTFAEISGCTISIGIGHTLMECLMNLNKAKLGGKNRIVEPAGSVTDE